jgi:phosphoglycolate phosphatase-like HAD superfamily hydrolase
MIGDSPYDVQAAGKAHVAVIALRCGGFSDQDLKDAIALYNDPSDLLANYDTSPLGARSVEG